MADRIAEIRERLAGATPGPWKLDDPDGDRDWVPGIPKDSTFRADFGRVWEVGVQVEHGLTGWRFIDVPTTEADAQLIAHAPADLAFLLAELDRLQKLVNHDCDAAEGALERAEAEADRLREVERAARDVLDDINRSLPDWEACDGCENDEPRKRLVALRTALEGTAR